MFLHSQLGNNEWIMTMKFPFTSKGEETANPMWRIRHDYTNKPFTNNQIPWEFGNQIIEYEDSSFVGCYRGSTDKCARSSEGL